MKSIFMTIGAALFMIAVVSDANAVTCAKGVYRAGCAGRNGAAVVRRPLAVAPRRVVVAPANRRRCAWVNGRGGVLGLTVVRYAVKIAALWTKNERIVVIPPIHCRVNFP